MKRQNYRILMVAAIGAMLLVPVVPSMGWYYIGSYLPSDPPYGSGGDSYSHWEYNFSESTSADSGGVSASGTCNASTWVDITVRESGPTAVSRSVSAECSTWGESYYGNDQEHINDPLYACWSVSGNGRVECSGSVDDDYCDGSTYADSSASGYTGADEGYGYGSAGGSASTRNELGSASVSWGGDTEEGDWSVSVGYGWYGASLPFSVEGEDSDPDPYYGWQFTADASVYAGSGSYGSASLTEGIAFASSGSSASCSGSSSVSVSY